MKILAIIITFNIYTLFSQSQYKLLIQDQYNGGVSFVGVDFPNINTTIPYHIEPNSNIKKVYMIYVIQNNSDTLSMDIKINNFPYHIEQNNISTKFKSYLGGNWVFNNTSLLDCTNAFNNLNNNINLEIEYQQNLPTKFRLFYFVIEYENSNLPLVNIDIFLNEQNTWVPMEYTLTQYNKIDTTKDVSLGLLTTDICGLWDPYKIIINQDSIGLIYGSDNINQGFCRGVGGHFYHQNETTYGLDDDTPDNLMDNSDALANIKPYITNPNSFALDFIYLANSNNNIGPTTQDFPDGLTNSIHAFILAYTPTCNATNINMAFTDTSICKGESVMLQGNGGVTYKWEPSTYLSDNTIANPICTAQQPIWYTCTITNADTCSKTIPVFVDVNTPPTLTATTTADTCGYTEIF